MDSLADRYSRIQDRIAAALARSGRSAGAVRLLGVTKRVEAARIREAIGLGLADIGENRVQEAGEKFPALGGLACRAHLIGHLQKNKARRALGLFDSIRSLDSVELAGRLDGMLGASYPVFIQVESGDEATKSGVSEAGLSGLVEAVRASRWLRLEGLMAIPPFLADPESVRPYFRKLAALAEAHGRR
jgi:pyridoxal phosphate enzyme (YggS family)